MRRLALAAPRVAFRLEIDGRVVFEAPAHDRLERVAALFGPEAAAVLLPVSGASPPPADPLGPGALRISGYVCSPAVSRATPMAQALVVNHRPVADPVLRTAVQVAYRDVIAAGRHPIVALYLDLPPDELDVNVHPAKAELRFRDPGRVRSLVIGSVRRALGGGTGQAGAMPTASSQRTQAWGRPSLVSAGAMPTASPRQDVPAGGIGRVPAATVPSRPRRAQLAHAAPLAEHPLGAPVAQLLDTYVIAVAADGFAGPGRPARRP